MATNVPIPGSYAIHGVKPNLDVDGNLVMCKITVDDTFTPPRLVVELPDRALRDLGKVDIAQIDSNVPVIRPALTVTSSNGTPISSATNTTAVSAPSAGNHLKIHRFHVANSGATATWVYLRNGAGGTLYYPAYLPTNGLMSINIALSLSTATACVINTSAAGNVEWTIEHETVAD